MKFDADHAFASISNYSTLTQHDLAHSPIETTWREAGWTVTHLSCLGREPLRRPGGTIQAVFVVVGVGVARLTEGWLSYAGLLAAGFFLLCIGRNAGISFRRLRTVNVLATIPARSNRPRLIVLTNLSMPILRLGGSRRWLHVLFAAVAGSLTATIARGWPGILQVVCATWLIQGLVFLVVDYLPNESTSDNASGLALVEELARTWPKLAKSRVDVQFLVIDGPEDMIVDLGDAIDGSTLIVSIADPGLAGEMRVAGDDVGLELALAATKDLWIPAVASLVPPKPPVVMLEYGGFVRLEGKKHASVRQYEPAALGRAGQLVLELALRWGKRVQA